MIGNYSSVEYLLSYKSEEKKKLWQLSLLLRKLETHVNISSPAILTANAKANKQNIFPQ